MGLSAAVAAGWFIAFPVGVANADCTGADFGAGSGCPPPDNSSDSSGSNGAESWPPTAVDWPPSQSSESGGGEGKGKQTTPIVMPDGQPTPSAKPASSTSDSDTTSTPPTPIVPVGATSTAPTQTAIVTPAASTP